MKYEFSAFFCTKHQVKIFKTRENISRWKFQKNWGKNFFIKIFLPPSLVFYPFIWDLHITHDKLFSSNFNKLHYFSVKKWGKKLVRGVENFWFVKYGFSALFCTKNHVKIFKTHRENFFHIPRWFCFFSIKYADPEITAAIL